MNDIHQLLSKASTAAGRTQAVSDWLIQSPNIDDVQNLFKEWANKDKGAAKLLKEHLSEHKRTQQQGEMVLKWSAKAEQLLAQNRMAIADALAWQRDAAKEGAPLSQSPLTELKEKLHERVVQIEDLQNVANVQKEAASLLAQRIELLSDKSLSEIESSQILLAKDVDNWMTKTQALTAHTDWASVDARFDGAMESATVQLRVVWEAFCAAWEQTQLALKDEQAPLPAVSHWAAQVRAKRRSLLDEQEQTETAEEKAKRAALRAQLQAQRKAAQEAIEPILARLEEELSLGHGKASTEVAQKLRDAFKDSEDLLDVSLQSKIHAALAAAGELSGWQRWRADQLREELIVKVQELLKAPQSPRKQQEALRQLREEWKRTDLGGIPNHGLWRKFDHACSEAHKPVQEWVGKIKEEEATQVGLREALIAEIAALAQDAALQADFKKLYRLEFDYQKRWRDGGHVSEKKYEQLFVKYKAAMNSAFGTLHQAQRTSIGLRKTLIEQATQIAASESLPIAEIKALQERWRLEAQSINLDRKTEQKMWDQFRRPIDAAFERKDVARKQERAAHNQAESAIFAAIEELEKASASGDGQVIQKAMQHLEWVSNNPSSAVQPQTLPSATESTPTRVETRAQEVPLTQDAPAATLATAAGLEADKIVDTAAQTLVDGAQESSLDTLVQASEEPEASEQVPTPAVAPAPVKKIIAVRGDDRPGAQARHAPPATSLGGRDRAQTKSSSDSRFGAKAFPSKDGIGKNDSRGELRRDSREPRQGRGFEPRHEGPRLSLAAQSALRKAKEGAQKSLRQLSEQAHGAALLSVLDAWQARDSSRLPKAADLGKAVNTASYKLWSESIGASAKEGPPQTELLRLEMASGVPSPAEHQTARRSLQLQLLTQKHGLTPIESWVQDTAKVFASVHDAEAAQRLQAVLKAMLRS